MRPAIEGISKICTGSSCLDRIPRGGQIDSDTGEARPECIRLRCLPSSATTVRRIAICQNDTRMAVISLSQPLPCNQLTSTRAY